MKKVQNPRFAEHIGLGEKPKYKSFLLRLHQENAEQEASQQPSHPKKRHSKTQDEEATQKIAGFIVANAEHFLPEETYSAVPPCVEEDKHIEAFQDYETPPQCQTQFNSHHSVPLQVQTNLEYSKYWPTHVPGYHSTVNETPNGVLRSVPDLALSSLNLSNFERPISEDYRDPNCDTYLTNFNNVASQINDSATNPCAEVDSLLPNLDTQTESFLYPQSHIIADRQDLEPHRTCSQIFPQVLSSHTQNVSTQSDSAQDLRLPHSSRLLQELISAVSSGERRPLPQLVPSRGRAKPGDANKRKRNSIPDQTDAWQNVRRRSTPPIAPPPQEQYPPYSGQPDTQQDYHTLQSGYGYNQASRYPPAREEAPPPLSARDKTISWLTSSEQPPTELPESADGRGSKVDSYRSRPMSHWTARDVAHFLIEAIYDLGISYEDADFSQLSSVDGQRLLDMTPRHLDRFVHDEGSRLHDYVRRHHNHEMISDSSYSVSNEVCEQGALHTPPPHHMAPTTSPMHSNMHPGFSTISHTPSVGPSMSYDSTQERHSEGLRTPPLPQGGFGHDMHQQKPDHYPHTTGMTTYCSGMMTHSGTLSYSSAMHSHGAEMKGHSQGLACHFPGMQSQSQEMSRHSTGIPAHTTGSSLSAGLPLHPATMPSLSPVLQSFPSLMSAHSPSPMLTTPSPHLQSSTSPGGYIPQAEPFPLQLPLTGNHGMGKPFPRLSETMMFSSAGELENIGTASSQQDWQARCAPRAYGNHSDKDESSDDDDDDDDDEEEEVEVEVKPPEPPKKRGPGRPPKPENERKKKKKTGRLWEFIRNLLLNPETCPSIVRWEDPENGVFRFVQSEKVAERWGMRKNNEKMNYEKLSRAMRYYYKGKVFEPVLGRRLVYKFGANAKGWKPNNANFENLH